MTDKPAAAAPTILGREVTIVTPGERRCTVDFGAIEAGYTYIPSHNGSAHPPFNWWIKVRAHEHRGAPIDGSELTEPGAVEANERALFAMRDAIPGRAREPAAVEPGTAVVGLETLKPWHLIIAKVISPEDESEAYICAEPQRDCDDSQTFVLGASGVGWKPFHFDDSTPVREGESYVFAVRQSDGDVDYFVDAIVWDAETDAEWSNGEHGWDIDDVTSFMPLTLLPAPPDTVKL